MDNIKLISNKLILLLKKNSFKKTKTNDENLGINKNLIKPFYSKNFNFNKNIEILNKHYYNTIFLFIEKETPIELFEKFLKEYNCYDKFINNLYNDPINQDVITLEMLYKKVDSVNYLNDAFFWADTEEGYAYWSNLHTKWCTTIENINKIIHNNIKRW